MNYTTDYAGALPEGVSDWTLMEGWQDTETEEYKFTFENGLFTLTEFKWVFTWRGAGVSECVAREHAAARRKYGATYNGTGKYVTEAGATVKEVYAYLSEHIDVTAKASKPINYGTTESPLGGIDVDVEATSHGMFESTTVGCHITLHGDGTSRIAMCDQN